MAWLSGVGAAPNIAAFGTWRGRPNEVAATWDDDNVSMVNAWAFQPGGELESWTGAVSIAVGGFRAPETWAQAAAGNFDSRWTTCLTNMRDLRAGRAGTIYIRPFHEMNGNWMDWSVYSGDEANFVTAWRRFRALQQSIYPASKLNFCPNNGSAQLDWRTYWPGNAYVDVVGVDYYNQWPTITDDASWTAALTLTTIGGAPQGLQTWLDYAASVGKPLVIDEWAGVADAGDNPAFIQHMHDFFVANGGTTAGKLLYETYFDSNETTYSNNFDIYPATRQPNTAAKYQELWSADLQDRLATASLTVSATRSATLSSSSSVPTDTVPSITLPSLVPTVSPASSTLPTTQSATASLIVTFITGRGTFGTGTFGSGTFSDATPSVVVTTANLAITATRSVTAALGTQVATASLTVSATRSATLLSTTAQIQSAAASLTVTAILAGTGVQSSISVYVPPPPQLEEKLEWVDPDGVAILLTQRLSGKGRWMPPVKIVRDQYAGQLGTRARQVTLDTASVIVPVLVTAANADNYRNLVRDMASSLNPLRGPGKLRATLIHADTSVTVREMAAYYVAGMDFPEDELDIGYPSLLFNSEGPPFWMDATATTIVYTNSATEYKWFPLGGTPWASLALNESTIYAQATIINDGDAPAYPVWKLAESADGVIQLDNWTTGQSLWFDYTITPGQTPVVVDTRPGTKSITQGSVSLYRYLTAWDMWPLERGRNDIVMTVPGATAATRVELAYWRGFLAA